MNPERKEILNLISLPGRMNAAEAAWRLGFEPDHIPILVSAGQLKPLGNPPPGAVKFFLTAEIEQKKGDARWMNKATELIRLRSRTRTSAPQRAGRSKVPYPQPTATQPTETIPMTVIPKISGVPCASMIRRAVAVKVVRSAPPPVTAPAYAVGIVFKNHAA